jgi:hypothetical protein
MEMPAALARRDFLAQTAEFAVRYESRIVGAKRAFFV